MTGHTATFFFEQPIHSVIVPTYNGANFLETALNSLVLQTLKNFEVIIVDDGSTDGTEALVEKFEKDIAIHYFPHAHQGNWLVSVNFAIGVAKSEYISILHQDDYWAPHRLEHLHKAISRFPHANLFFHSSIFVDREGKRLGFWRCPFSPSTPIVTPEKFLRKLLIQNSIAVPSIAAKKEAIVAAGLFDEQLWYSGDWKMWLAIGSRSDSIFIPEFLSAFRLHSLSQTAKRSDETKVFEMQHRASFQYGNELARQILETSELERVCQLGELSISINCLLASVRFRKMAGIAPFVKIVFRISPLIWGEYLQASRLFERVIARLRAGLSRPRR